MSLKGINYGQIDLEEDSSKLTLTNKHHSILSLNYSSIVNSTINKQDIII